MSSPVKALRLLFLGLIVWNGAGSLPVAIMEMLRYWQSGSGALTGMPNAFVWYVAGEIAHAAIILLFSILGLQSCRRGGFDTAATYAKLVLTMQAIVAVYHFVMVVFI